MALLAIGIAVGSVFARAISSWKIRSGTAAGIMMGLLVIAMALFRTACGMRIVVYNAH